MSVLKQARDRLFSYLPGVYSVWGRLFASFLLISGILSIIAFAAVLRFTDISQDMSELVEQQMPEIVQVNEVAAAVTELAAQATILSEPRLRKDRQAYQEDLNAQLLDLSATINQVRDPSWSQPAMKSNPTSGCYCSFLINNSAWRKILWPRRPAYGGYRLTFNRRFRRCSSIFHLISTMLFRG